MAAVLTFGSVPPLYREIYDVLCPNDECKVDREFFITFLTKVSSLPSQTLSEIWDMLDCRQGCLTRTALYKALALLALAQQGKSINEKVLETFCDQELPRPNLGNMDCLTSLIEELRHRHKSAFELSYSFQDICSLDDIKVEVVPERKGIFLKHVEYQISSQRHKSEVKRRYNDFLTLHDVLVTRFPCRAVPRIPPKKIVGTDAHFIERRRKALHRFLTLISRHPILNTDVLVIFFFTYLGSEVQHKMKDFKIRQDELMSSEFALKDKDLNSADAQHKLKCAREQIKTVCLVVTKLEEIVQRLVNRSQSYALDMQDLEKGLRSLGDDPNNSSEWATGGCSSWDHIKNGMKSISTEFKAVSRMAAQQATMQEDEILGKLHLFLDLLLAYTDMCDRHERDVIHDHQTALAKVINARRRVQATMRGSEVARAGDLESRITDQEEHVASMARRTRFAMYCIQMETRLVYLNMELLAHILESLVTLQTASHAELAQFWHRVKPSIDFLIPDLDKNTSMVNSVTSQSSSSPATISR